MLALALSDGGGWRLAFGVSASALSGVSVPALSGVSNGCWHWGVTCRKWWVDSCGQPNINENKNLDGHSPPDIIHQ